MYVRTGDLGAGEQRVKHGPVVSPYEYYLLDGSETRLRILSET